MLISDKINAAFNTQIGHELGNANQYVAIAAYFDGDALFELAKLYYKQAEEEREHAHKFIKFLIDAGAKVEIPAVAAPRNDFKSAEDAVQTALDAELRTTGQINDLMSLALSEPNYMAQIFLQWFVNEQLEEVSSATDRLQIVKRAGGPSILMVEAYLVHQTG